MGGDFFDRLDKYMTSRGLNDNKLTVLASLSVGALGKQRKGSRGLSSESIAKILYSCPDLSGDWLLTGEGEMLKKTFQTKTTQNATLLDGGAKGGKEGGKPKLHKTSPNEFEYTDDPLVSIARDSGPGTQIYKLRTDRVIERQRIPIYDMEAVAGLVPLFMDSYSQSVEDVIEATLIPKCDGGLCIVGDSMYPLLKSGDVVFYKQINDVRSGIIWGEIYLVSFDNDGEEYITVKYIKRSTEKDHIQLVSHNSAHDPLDIPLSRIRALALVKASLRLNTVK